MGRSRTFIKITNKDVFDKLETIERDINIIGGKVLWHTWAIGVIVIILAALIGLN